MKSIDINELREQFFQIDKQYQWFLYNYAKGMGITRQTLSAFLSDTKSLQRLTLIKINAWVESQILILNNIH